MDSPTLRSRYLEGWQVIFKCVGFALILWIMLIPLNVIQHIKEHMPETSWQILMVVSALIYAPLAFHWAYRATKKIGYNLWTGSESIEAQTKS